MHKIKYRLSALLSLSLLFIGCNQYPVPCTKQTKAFSEITYNEKNYRVDKKTKIQTGNASYYASCLQGRRTASGEVCNLNRYTAAHRSFPFGTLIRVTMLQNGKSVIVKVNDRGPYSKGRIVDLSRAAANEIGLTCKGVGKVKVEKLKKS